MKKFEFSNSKGRWTISVNPYLTGKELTDMFWKILNEFDVVDNGSGFSPGAWGRFTSDFMFRYNTVPDYDDPVWLKLPVHFRPENRPDMYERFMHNGQGCRVREQWQRWLGRFLNGGEIKEKYAVYKAGA